VLLALSQAVTAAAPTLTINQLMGSLAKHPPGAATFVEKKYIAILSVLVESSGELLFIAPNRLEKNTRKPRPETLLLDGDTLTLQRWQRKRVVHLKDFPEVAGMVDSIRATLAGDQQALERAYQLALDGGIERWTLTLTPLDSKVAGVVARIEMSGVRNEVKRIEIFQADGDRSVMQIEPASPTKAGAP